MFPDESRCLLAQPSLDTVRWNNGSVVFYTPPQPHIDFIVGQGFEIRLGLWREVDQLMGPMLAFSVIPHGNGRSLCVQCNYWPDSPIPVATVCETNRGSGALQLPVVADMGDERPLNLTVPRVQSVGPVIPRLRRTRMQVAGGTAGFLCVYCKNVLSRRQTLIAHIEKFHPNGAWTEDGVRM